MPSTYSIADLHGRYDLLSERDYVDRGPKSRQVIERLMGGATLIS
jgi:hypothetical protein